MYNKLYSNDSLERKLFSIEKQLTSFETNFHPATDENKNNNNNKQSHKHTCNLSVVLSLSAGLLQGRTDKRTHLLVMILPLETRVNDRAWKKKLITGSPQPIDATSSFILEAEILINRFEISRDNGTLPPLFGVVFLLRRYIWRLLGSGLRLSRVGKGTARAHFLNSGYYSCKYRSSLGALWLRGSKLRDEIHKKAKW